MIGPACACAACRRLAEAIDADADARREVAEAGAVVDRVHGLDTKPAAALGRLAVSPAGPTLRRASTARESRE